jgi:hypothetical protein
MSIIIAAMIAASATPQAAAPQSTSTTVPSITAPAQAEGGAPRAKATRYCVLSRITGSRIERKTCRTREAWLAEGFDPLTATAR